MNAIKAAGRKEVVFIKPKKSNEKGANHFTAGTLFLID
jgi:hypothetical protein